MTALLTTLAISIIGLLFLVGFKYAELRSGKVLLLPQWIHAREDMLQATSRYILVRGGSYLAGQGKRGARNLRGFVERLVRRVVATSHLRPTGQLQKNGTPRGYLKDIARHKESIRNGNSDSI